MGYQNRIGKLNGTEQRRHSTVTHALDLRLADVETLVAEDLPSLRRKHAQLEEFCRTEDERTRMLINDERTHRLKLANEQRSYVDNEDRLLRQSIQQLQCRTVLLSQSTFWQRLRWLVRGLR